jgi:DNA adenine methylase
MKRATWQRYKSSRSASSEMAGRTASADLLAGNGEAGLKDYPGAKNAPGVWQTIINNIPPHETFVEAFAGSAVITRRKRPATSTIVIEGEAAAHAALVSAFRQPNATLLEQFAIAEVGQHECQLGAVRLVRGCAVEWLGKNGGSLSRRAVIYCDPPYLGSVRADAGRRYYRREFRDVADHCELLDVLNGLRGVPVLLSGRRCKLYDSLLKDWRRVDYQTSTHAGPVSESLWCNFDEPTELHDYRFLGRDFRERERIKRKVSRWRARLARMPILERQLLAAAIAKNGDAS